MGRAGAGIIAELAQAIAPEEDAARRKTSASDADSHRSAGGMGTGSPGCNWRTCHRPRRSNLGSPLTTSTTPPRPRDRAGRPNHVGNGSKEVGIVKVPRTPGPHSGRPDRCRMSAGSKGAGPVRPLPEHHARRVFLLRLLLGHEQQHVGACGSRRACLAPSVVGPPYEKPVPVFGPHNGRIMEWWTTYGWLSVNPPPVAIHRPTWKRDWPYVLGPPKRRRTSPSCQRCGKSVTPLALMTRLGGRGGRTWPSPVTILG